MQSTPFTQKSLIQSADKSDEFSLLLELDSLHLELDKLNPSDPKKESLVNSIGLIITKINKRIESADFSSGKMLVANANRCLPATRISILQSFLQLHITPLPAERFITELLKLILESGNFSDLAEAADLATKSKLNATKEQKEDGAAKKADIDTAIIKRVNHAQLFLQDEIELQDLSAEKKATPVEVEIVDAGPYVNEWVTLVKRVTTWAENQIQVLWQAEQKNVLKATKQMVKHQKEQKYVQQPKKLTDKIKKDVTSLSSQQVKRALQHQDMQKMLDPENWVKLFNFFTAKVNFNLENYQNLFRSLKNDKDLPLSFFVSLLNKNEFRDDAKNRQKLIKYFFDMNQAFCSDEKWLNQLFLKISRIPFYLPENAYFYQMMDDILFLSKINPEKVMAVLVHILDDISKQEFFQQYSHSFLFTLATAEHLFKSYKLNPLRIKLPNGHSFAEAMLLQWQKFQDSRLSKQPAELVPHFYYTKQGSINSIYQIKVDYSDRISRLTHYVLWSELVPLLSQEEQFIQHVKSLFGHDINDIDIKAIRDVLIKNEAFILSDELLSILKNAVLHKLKKLRIDKNPNEFETALCLLNKEKVHVFERKLNEKSRQYELVKVEISSTPENKAGQGGMVFLHEKGQHYLLISAKTVIENQKLQDNPKTSQIHGRVVLLKMQYLLDGFIRKIFNSIHYKEKNITEDLIFLPEILGHLEGGLRALVLQHIFDEPLLTHPARKTDSEEKVEVVAGNKERVGAIFRMFALYRPHSSQAALRFDQVKREIVNNYEKIFNSNIYYQLFANSISPLFYESFESPLARQFILLQIKNPSFLKLYQSHSIESQYDLVRLFNIPSLDINKNLNGHLLNEHLLKCFVKIKSKAVSQINQRQIYNILSSLIIKYDDAEPKVDEFNTLLTQMTDIFIRLNWNIDNKELLSRMKTILENEDRLNLMSEFHSQMKKAYPLLDDIGGSVDEILDAGNISSVLDLITQFNERGLTHQLTDKDNQLFLQKLLNLAARESKHSKDDRSSEIIPALTSNLKSHVDFNVRLKPSDQSWLEYAWEHKQFRNVHQLIKAGANVTGLCKNKQKTFLRFILDEMTRFPEMFQMTDCQAILSVALATIQKSSKEMKSHESSEMNHFLIDWVQSLTSEQYAACVKFMTVPEILKQIGLSSIQMGRFDFFQKTNDQFKQITRFPLWLRLEEFDPRFVEAFSRALHVRVDANFYEFLRYPGFDTTCQLVSVYYNNAGDYETLLLTTAVRIGLATKNDHVCDLSEVTEYLNSLIHLERKHIDWNRSRDTQNLHAIILNAFESHATQLSLSTISAIARSLATLNLPPNYPGEAIERELTRIFTQVEVSQWRASIGNLHDGLRSFSIAGKDPREIQPEFEKCDPSLNSIVKRPPEKKEQLPSKSWPFSFWKKVNVTPEQSPIEYYFKVFIEVSRMMAEKKGGSSELATDALTFYQKSEFGKWDHAQDSNFMWAISYASKITKGQTPYHAQIVTAMGTAYSVAYSIQARPECLIEVASGGGKTNILAEEMLTLIKLYGVPFDPNGVAFFPITTMTGDLARNNATENKPLFEFFGHHCSHELKEKDKDKDTKASIIYTTTQSLIFKLRDEFVQRKIADDQSKPRKWILGLDECDVEVILRKNEETNTLGYEIPEMNPVLQVIKNNRHLPEERAQGEVQHSAEYKALSPLVRAHVDYYFSTFYSRANKVSKGLDEKTAATGAKTTFEKSTGIVSHNTYDHFATQFIQFASGAHVTPYRVVNCVVSNADLLDQCKVVFGYTGTLNTGSLQEKKSLAQDGFAIARAPRFTAQKLKLNPTRVHKTKEAWQNAILEEAKVTRNQGRPVIAFVITPEDVDKFYSVCNEKEAKDSQRLYKFRGDEGAEEHDRLVEKATEPSNLTIAALVCGRGKDFRCYNKEIDSKGGVKIIKAAPVSFKSADIQLNNRTARGENEGEVSAHYLEEDLRALFKEVDMFPKEINDHNVDALLEEAWEKMLIKQLSSDKETKHSVAHKLSNRFYQDSSLTGKDAYSLFVMGPLQKAFDGSESEALRDYEELVRSHRRMG